MERGKALSTPLPPYVKLCLNDCPKIDAEKAEMAKVPYSFAVGSLMYAMICTRPDIAFAMGVVHRYMSNPGKKHWEAVKGIMRYLKGTRKLCICFGRNGACVFGYTDVDYAGDMDKRRSTSGYVFMFTGGALEISVTKLHINVNHRSRVYCSIRGLQGSYMACSTSGRLGHFS